MQLGIVKQNQHVPVPARACPLDGGMGRLGMFNDFGTCPSAHSAHAKISTPIEKNLFNTPLRKSRKKFLARGCIFFFMCISTYLFLFSLFINLKIRNKYLILRTNARVSSAHIQTWATMGKPWADRAGLLTFSRANLLTLSHNKIHPVESENLYWPI